MCWRLQGTISLVVTFRPLAASHFSTNRICELWSACSVKTDPPRVQGEMT